MSWIAGHLLLYKEKQDTKEEEILNKKVNRISVTKKKQEEMIWIAGLLFQHKEKQNTVISSWHNKPGEERGRLLRRSCHCYKYYIE